jgi:hypothetical protein
VSAVASQLSFEVLRFAAEPVSSEVALLELEGRFRAGSRRRLGVPRLVVEHADGDREVGPVAAGEATAEPDGALWRASFAVPLEELGGGSFSLAVGRELLVGLPAPDPAAGQATGDREVRLAREANALRRTADEARAAAAAALVSAGDERRAREATEAQLTELRLARDDLSRRVAGVEDELAQARRDHAAELVRRDAERDSLLAGRNEEAARAAEERVAEIEAEAAEARRALRNARAEAEGYRRELERERERVEAAEASVRRGRVTEIAGERVEAPDEAATEIATLEPPTSVAEAITPSPPAPPAPGPEAITPSPPAPPAPGPEAITPSPPSSGREGITLSPPSPGPEGITPGPDDPALSHAEATSIPPPKPAPGAPGETVRVLGARRPRRTGEGPPAEAAPGTAAIGARYIEPAQAGRRSALAAWLTRPLALAALAIAIIAILVVVKPF